MGDPVTVQKFRKQPVEVEAVRWTGENGAELREWSDGAVVCGTLWAIVKTLEGEMRGDLGDWIIRGVKGEFYPCKPDIFEATYEPAQEPAQKIGGMSHD